MSNTALDEMSRQVPEEQGMTDKDDAKKRADTMAKVIVRLGEVTSRIELINQAAAPTMRDMIGKDSLGQASDQMSEFDSAVSALEAQVSAIKQTVQFLREVSFPERMTAEDCQTFNTEDNRITKLTKVLASVVSGQNEAAHAWLRANGYEALIKETVNSSSLSGAAKEMLENGKELPEDIFRTHFKDSISITRKKKKAA